MHGTSLPTWLVAATLGLVPASMASGTADVVAEARRLLAREDGVAASKLLEEALPEAGPSKASILELLERAYEVAVSQSQRTGRVHDAETYRENLKILARNSRGSASSTTKPIAVPVPKVATPPPAKPPEDKPPTPEPPPTPAPLPEAPTPPQPAQNSNPAPFEIPPVEPVPPKAEVPFEIPPADSPPPVVPPQDDLSGADVAFEAKNYREAGRIYSSLAKDKKLPTDRRDHWLYCRASDVVARINDHPQTAAEWGTINDELKRMRAVNPDFYLSEYLRNLAAERQVVAKKPKPSNKLVVRGSAPEEPAPKDRPVRTASNAAATESPRPASNPPPNPIAARIGANPPRWQILDSTNFRVFHDDPALASKVSQAAEAARAEVSRRWSGQGPARNWSPTCEIYLYPTAGQYAQMTGQPEDSPGFSTMGMNAGRIISRRVNLRADHPSMVAAVLPHEITHVVLADFFTDQQIPRWADEGLSVLSEPRDEQQRRAADLVNPLNSNRIFAVDALMNMDYPDPQYWGLYYAQSVSLSRFLVEQGSPAQMLQFLKAAQKEGYEAGLRKVYRIDGFADLQRRWLEYARGMAETRTAKVPSTEPDLKVR